MGRGDACVLSVAMAAESSLSLPACQGCHRPFRAGYVIRTGDCCTHLRVRTVLCMDTYSLVEARNQLGQLVGRVRHGREHILISEYGKPAAVLMPIEELEELQRFRDEADLALAQSIREDPESRWIPQDEVLAVIEADEAADRKAC
ncbi:type II toxin-antitoxin system Phd/YefM family antitoxin [Streptomyces rectiverticillatus]|nr:type II toxin-antitoxin system Phd/YefM family antitoxin [Streptomyces rectiverticillatus]